MSFKFDFDLEPDTEDSANDVFNNDANIQQTDICKANVIGGCCVDLLSNIKTKCHLHSTQLMLHTP